MVSWAHLDPLASFAFSLSWRESQLPSPLLQEHASPISCLLICRAFLNRVSQIREIKITFEFLKQFRNFLKVLSGLLQYFLHLNKRKVSKNWKERGDLEVLEPNEKFCLKQKSKNLTYQFFILFCHSFSRGDYLLGRN